jgi:signal transduction histidine kinase
VDAARDELGYDAAAAGAMLEGVKCDIQGAMEDIRRLIYELRPPALDDLGLAVSLGLLAERYRSGSLAVDCELPLHLPPLPAAVEVAAYRICAEALTNVVRHARAHTCRVTLAVGEQLELEIWDDGCGFDAPPGVPQGAAQGRPPGAGMGLLSLAERTAELGGTCAIESAPGRGTAIRVALPL